MNVNFNTEDKILSRIAEKFEKRLKQDVTVTLKIDNTLDELCGKIENNIISAGSYHQLFDTAGRFLRNPEASGTFKSFKSMPGMYFATHYNNYYDAAPIEELYNYIDDLAFWGMGILGFWFDMHHYKNMKEGERQATRLLSLISYANSIGLKTSMTLLADESFADSPVELRADWTCGHDGYIHNLNDHYHVEICPSKKGGIEKILEYRREMIEVFKDAKIDYFLINPYDQGGCTCTECAPWGGNGYVKCTEALIPLLREYFPKAEFILSTWQFRSFIGTDIEFEMLNDKMKAGALPEIKYIMANAPRGSYPAMHGMCRPLIGFPEISMGEASPWGGYGITPQTALWVDFWDGVKDHLDGGLPYSEGIYEDINKVIFLRLYRDNKNPIETLREYVEYEFSLKGDLAELAVNTVLDMEKTLPRKYSHIYVDGEGDTLIKNPDMKYPPHYYGIAHPELALGIEEAIKKINATLPDDIRKGIKWQLIYLRAVIDAEIVRNNFYRNDTILGYFKELVKLCHLEKSGKSTLPDIWE